MSGGGRAPRPLPRGAGGVRCLDCGAAASAKGDGTPIVLDHAADCPELERGHDRLAPVGSLTARTLDELQSRARAVSHSIADRRSWDVVRTPAGHHVCLPTQPPGVTPAGFTIVAAYRDGKEV